MSNTAENEPVALAPGNWDSQETFLLRMELFAAVAAEMKAKYNALVNAGFTPGAGPLNSASRRRYEDERKVTRHKAYT